jgi:hypothetical protein
VLRCLGDGIGLPIVGRRFGGLILDFAGVLTSNMVEVIDLFEVRERLPAERFLRAWGRSPPRSAHRSSTTPRLGQPS